jgi:hypothetical protein
MEYLENFVGSVRNYYYFTENDNEISGSIRLYQSNYDWIGTLQTLVCNKTWLNSLILNLIDLEKSLESFHQRSSELSIISPVLVESENNDHPFESLLPRLRRVIELFQTISQYRLSNYSKDLCYFFSEDLYESDQIKNAQHGFLNHLTDYLRSLDPMDSERLSPQIEQVKAQLMTVFTSENLEKVYEASLLFGFVAPQLQARKADQFKLQKYLESR